MNRARSRVVSPWRWRLSAQTLVIALPPGYRAMGWAPLGGGLTNAATILNHQIAIDDRAAAEFPRKYLSRLAQALGLSPRTTIAMMTGANVRRGGFATVRRGQLGVSAWCSAGCSNSLRVGDRATAARVSSGTINIAVAISRALSVAALVEAIEIAVEARVIAVQQAGVLSRRSGLPASGTGTDCVVITAPDGKTNHLNSTPSFVLPRVKERGRRQKVIDYCGKHTVPGELIGCAVLKSCAQAFSRDADSRVG
jgi:adenosylcobinamide amidohydrolase